MKIFNIQDYGAQGDGATDDTTAIQQAIDKCSREGGGRVLCPPGTYAIRPLVLRSGVDLHLEKECVLLGSPDPAHYADWQSAHIDAALAPYNAKYLLIAENETDISLTGKGAIHGNGPAFYDVSEANGLFWKIRDITQRPGRMIWFIRCRNVTIEEISVRDSPAWTFWLLGCENVRVHNLDCETPYAEINADGMDVDSCRDVSVTNSRFRNGDDCIILRAINRILREEKPCENVRVDNCSLQSNCNAIRLSYVRDGTIRNASFTNISISESRRGIICQIPSRTTSVTGIHAANNAETALDAKPIVENISFSNINVQAMLPIWFYLNDDALATRVSNITFENMHLLGTTTSVFKGNGSTPIENIALRNIRVTLQNGKTLWGSSPDLQEKAAALQLAHCCNVSLENFILEGATEKQWPLFDFDGATRVEIGSVINRTSHPVSAA
jgi:polygalacturonase